MGGTGNDLYAILGVRSDASPTQIKAAWRSRVRETHPDHGGDRREFARIQAAWEVLKTPESRERYDASVAGDVESGFSADQFEQKVEDIFTNAFNKVFNDEFFEELTSELSAIIIEHFRATDSETTSNNDQVPRIRTDPVRCSGTTVKGVPCRNAAVAPSGFCHVHEPPGKASATPHASQGKRKPATDTVGSRDNGDGSHFDREPGPPLQAVPLPQEEHGDAELIDGSNVETNTGFDASESNALPSGRSWSTKPWVIALVAVAVVLTVGVVFLRSGSDDADNDSERFSIDQTTEEIADNSAELGRWVDYVTTATGITTDVVGRVGEVATDATSDVTGWTTGEYADEAIAARHDAVAMLDEWNERPRPVPELVAECDSGATQMFETTARVADDFSDMAIAGSTDIDRLNQIVVGLGAISDMADEQTACLDKLGEP